MTVRGKKKKPCQRFLAREGQWLSGPPPLPARTTVGGLISSALGGLLRPLKPRTLFSVIGIAAALTDGRIVAAAAKCEERAGYAL